MRCFLLFDNNNRSNGFIASKLGVPVTEVRSPERGRKIFCWLKGVVEVLKASRGGDTIICWYDFQAVMCWWMCRLLLKRRNIVCINVLLKDKPSLRNKLVSYLYRAALTSNNFKASVTSREYGEWLNRKLGINAKYTLIHDVYHDSYEYRQKVNVNPMSVFCGGSNGRDWNFIIDVAHAMPDIKFNIVMPYSIYLKHCSRFSANMNVRYDISYDEFMKELCSSSIVCLPLDTEAPAGLIVMFQAAANLKPIITTKTVTTSEYINDERGMAIKNDKALWVNVIRSCLNDNLGVIHKAANLKEYLTEVCSEELFVKGIMSMLKEKEDMVSKLKLLAGTLYGALYGLKKGRNVSITPPIKVRGVRENVVLGDNVSISASAILLGVTPQAKIEIGNNIRIAHHLQISCANLVKICSDVNIAPFVFITDHNHRFENPDIPVKDQGISMKPGASVVIGEGSWIGTKAVIVGDVKIGRHCVIGASSVVTKDIPDYSIAVGSPAKVIRHYDFAKGEWVRC